MQNSIGKTMVVVLLLAAGVWLAARGAAPAPETSARLSTMRELGAAAPGRPTASGRNAPVPQSGTLDPAGSVNLADVPAGIDESTSLYELWLRGEVDIHENESMIAPAEIAALQEEAQRLPASDRLMRAPAGPSSLAPSPANSGFDSLKYGGWVPPDPELAVGPNHIIAVVNASFAIYNKTGGTLVAPTTFVNFFSGFCSGTLFDPNVVYDEAADRYLMAIDDDGVNYCIAASKTANPTGAWWFYVVPTGNASDFFDYPHAGIGLDHLFMGANMFRGGFLESRVYAFDKWAMYDGGSAGWAMKPLPNTEDTPQPMHFHGHNQGTWPTDATHYFFTDHEFDGAQYSTWSWDDPLGGSDPQLVNTVDLAAYTGVAAGLPINAPQKGNTRRLQANDFRPHDFEYRNGYAWSAQTISCNPGGGTVNCVRWAKIDPVTGTIADAGVYATNGVHRFFANLAVNECGDMAMGYTASSTSMFPSIYVTGRENSDPPGTTETETLQKAGTIAYTAFDSNPHRWGDYTGMTIDPDGKRFWYLGQYSRGAGTTSQGRWGTHIRSFTYPSCGGGGGGDGADGFDVSAGGAGTINGVAFTPADILHHDYASNTWQLLFDASDVGISANLAAFYREPSPDGNDPLYLTFAAAINIPGLGKVTPWDIVKFTPTSLGPNTAGSFSWHFDGSDAGLTTTGEKIDALGMDSSGHLLISVTGAGKVPGLNFADEDVARFEPTSTGSTTVGTWHVFFDGSAKVAGLGVEDINGFHTDPATDDLYITIVGAFNLGGVSGNGKDIVKLTPTGSGTYTPSLYWDGSAFGFPKALDGVELTYPAP